MFWLFIFHCHFSNSLRTKIQEWLGMNKLMGSHQALLKGFQTSLQRYFTTSSLAKMRYIAMAVVIFEVQESLAFWEWRPEGWCFSEFLNMSSVFVQFSFYLNDMTFHVKQKNDQSCLSITKINKNHVFRIKISIFNNLRCRHPSDSEVKKIYKSDKRTQLPCSSKSST